MKTIKNFKINGKKILVRVDFNVPKSDDSRIRVSLPTINYLLENGVAKIILISHLGRPKGKVVEELKLKPVAEKLKDLLKIQTEIKEVNLDNFPAYQVSDKIFLLENIRFYPEEEKNDVEFTKKLAHLGDSPRGEAGIFINDAFSASHRAHSSTEGIAHFLPSFAGFALEKEVEELTKILKNPGRPFVCILGGAKVSDKIRIIENLAPKVDYFLLGGVMANTFLVAQGINLKDSLVSNESISVAKELLDKFKEKIILPSDLVVRELNGKEAVLDIGPKDVEKFSQYIEKAKTIFWNGNLGMTEKSEYVKGSRTVAEKIIASKALTVVGGGDTVGFLKSQNLTQKFSFISLGGGATLEFLAGKKLPALNRLNVI